MPPDDVDEEGDGDHSGQDLQGTGMAEGVGNKDVSEEIVDEEQILGTKDGEKDDDNEGESRATR